MWICHEKNLENSAYHVWDDDYAIFVSIWPSGGGVLSWSPVWLFLLPRFLFALRSISLSVRSFPHLRRPGVYPPPFYLPTLFSWTLGFLYPFISSPYFILVLRFEIYDDARTRALASSDYVYDLIEGSWACGKRSCTLLYIYNSHRTAPHFNLRLGARFTCRSELFCSIHSPPHCRGWVRGLEDSRSELLIECSLADARALESGFRVGKAACEIVIYLFSEEYAE